MGQRWFGHREHTAELVQQVRDRVGRVPAARVEVRDGLGEVPPAARKERPPRLANARLAPEAEERADVGEDGLVLQQKATVLLATPSRARSRPE